MIPEHAMKRSGNRVIPSTKAIVPVVFTAQVFESPDGRKGYSAPFPMSPLRFDRDTLRIASLARNRLTDETIVIFDHEKPDEQRSQQEEKG